MNHGETSSPFKNRHLSRANELASKLDQPIFTIIYRVATFIGAAMLAVGIYAGKQWLDERIAKNPVVYNVGTRLAEVEKKTDVAAQAILVASASQEKIGAYLRDGLKAQQAMTVQITALSQKVEDGQHHAEEAVKRIDSRLDQLSRPRVLSPP